MQRIGLVPPTPVDSTGLIGRTINGQKITAANLDSWVRPQLPPKGVRKNANDAAVWNWTVNPAKPTQYLGEPEDTTAYPDYYNNPAMPGAPDRAARRHVRRQPAGADVQSAERPARVSR